MNYRPCFVVPAYNHSQAAVGTVSRLLTYGIPVILIDDGSGADDAKILQEIASGSEQVQLVVLPKNMGKGGAVMAGLLAAKDSGFTHGMQVDADGQHDLSVLAEFLADGERCANSIICGYPVYDKSIPLGRKMGRYLTHFWVWVETLSFQIKDSMCGFRLYPLEATCGLISEGRLPHRMNFDIEIFVRLFWRGVPMIWKPVRVTYPVDGRSHFRPLLDNLMISWTHTRLVCAMPYNLMKKWFRGPATSTKSKHWAKVRERGSRLGLAFTSWVHRYLGRWLALPIVPLIVTYFFLTGASARRATMDYLRRLHEFTGGNSPKPGLLNAYRLFMQFGFSAHDKLTAWLDPKLISKIDFPDIGLLQQARESGRGALIIGAHIGNLEMMRAVAARYGFKGFHAVVHFSNAEKFTKTIKEAAPDSETDLIHVSNFGPETAIRLREIIDRGECIVIVGDRTPVSENGQTVTVNFFGSPADFPRGPFILAAALECPVYLFFCIHQAGGYKVFAEKFSDKITLTRARRAEELNGIIQKFAERLERLCVDYPLQWFNFFDFWNLR